MVDCDKREIFIMGTVHDVAVYILEKEGQLSTMKLQKLCYYSQAWALVWDDAPLFNEDFQAWANGPVCPELFHVSQGQFAVIARQMRGSSSHLTAEQKQTIDAVLDFYGPKDAQWLSQLTHMEGPWQEARAGLPTGVPCANVITKESMAMYYGGL